VIHSHVLDGAVDARGPTTAASATSLANRVAEVVEVVELHAERTDADSAFPEEALAALRDTGLLGLLVPQGHGGLGGSVTDLVNAGIALGRADLSVAMIFVMHCQQVAALDRYASAALRDRLLPEIADGSRYLGSVTTESATGGRLLTATSASQHTDGMLAFDRHAPIVTGGEHADGFLITMRAPDATGDHQVSLVYADRGQIQVTRTGDWRALGMRASDSAPLRLRGTVPLDQVVGKPGAFREIVTQVFAPLAHLGWSAAWLGTAAGSLARVLRVVRDRGSRSTFDLDSELLLSRLARTRGRLETVHALLRRCERIVALAADLSRPRYQLLLNTLKTTAAENCYAAVDELIAAMGMRHGYLADSPTRLERALRDLRSASLNYNDDRLFLANGKLGLLDPEVRLV
jgi:alkylation response protein AidB-like acyl-CoA dehydrogenase